jgi:hypothetical protein
VDGGFVGWETIELPPGPRPWLTDAVEMSVEGTRKKMLLKYRTQDHLGRLGGLQVLSFGLHD